MSELPSLIVITDWSLGRDALLAKLDAALSVSPRVAVQHRHPGATARELLDEARLLRALCDRHGAALFVNDRVEVALSVGAHVHLPSHGFRPRDVRPHLPEGLWISAAVHDSRELAEAAGADLVLLSPVFDDGSKAGDGRDRLGVDGFAALAQESRVPALALGGISPENAARLPDAAGFAVISAVLGAADPQLATIRLLARGGTLLA